MAVILPDLPSSSTTQGGFAAHAGTTIIFLAHRDHCVPLSVGRTRLVGQLAPGLPLLQKEVVASPGCDGPSPLSAFSAKRGMPPARAVFSLAGDLWGQRRLCQSHILFYFTLFQPRHHCCTMLRKSEVYSVVIHKF